MFLTYLRRELFNRKRQTIVVSLGLALGVALVFTVSAVSNGVQQSQKQVLQSLYGLGTDISITKVITPDAAGQGGRRFDVGGGAGQRDANGNRKFSQSRLIVMPGTETFDVATIAQVSALSEVKGAASALKLTSISFSGQLPDFQNGAGFNGDVGGDNASEGAGNVSGDNGVVLMPPSVDQSAVPGDTLPQTVVTSTMPSPSPSNSANSRPKVNQGQGIGGDSNFSIETFSVMGIDPSVIDVGPLSSTSVVSGRALTSADKGNLVAVIDESYATSKSLAVGGTVSLADKDFEIVGIIASSTSNSETASNVYIMLDQAQLLSTNLDVVTNIYVKATSSTAIDGLVVNLKNLLPDATVSTTADLASSVSGSLSTASKLIDNLGKWLSIIVLSIAFLIAILFTTSGVTRRTREFGTLKALGWKSRNIVRQVAAESVVHGILGGAIGVGIGYVSVNAFNAYAPTVQASTSVFGGAAPPFGGGRGFGGGGRIGGLGSALNNSVDVVLKASATPTIIVSAISLALFGGILAGVFGGLRAARLRPAEALRSVA